MSEWSGFFSHDRLSCVFVCVCVCPPPCSDSVSSVGSLGTEDVGEGIRHWLGVPRGAGRGGSPYGSSTISSHGGRQSVTETMSTYSFR